MKTFLKLLAVLPLAIGHSLSIQAQQYQPVALLTGGTANISGSATSNYTHVVNVRGADNVGLYASWSIGSSSTDDVIFKLSKSANGAVFETTPSVLITNVCDGTNVVKYFNAISTLGVHSLQLSSIVNGATNFLTNLTVTVGVKNFFR